MQICLFFFVRRIAGERAAVFALAFPALAPTLYYSAEGRPYGLFLGYAPLRWPVGRRQRAVRRNEQLRSSRWPWPSLWFSIPATLASCCCFPSVRPSAAAFSNGGGWTFPCLPRLVRHGRNRLHLPFLGAAAEYRLHYWDADAFNHRMMYQAYLTFLLGRAQAVCASVVSS